MRRPGFTIIELIVAITIGSMMSAILYQTLYQIIRQAKRSQTFIDDYVDSIIISNQFERDIYSLVYTQKPIKRTEVASTQAGQKDSNNLKDSNNITSFVCSSADNTLKQLSCITTNTLPDIDHAASRISRVSYSLLPQTSGPLFQLMRTEIDMNIPNSTARPMLVMDNIESLQCACYYRTEDDQKGSSAFKKKSEWNSADTTMQPIPDYVELYGSYRSSNAGESIPFTCLVAIPIVNSIETDRPQAHSSDTAVKTRSQIPEQPAEG